MADLTLAPPRSDTGRGPLVLGTLGHTVNDAYTALLPALLPMFHLQPGLDETALAGPVAIFALSASLPGPFLGRLSDWFGAARVTAASVFVSAALLSLLAVVRCSLRWSRSLVSARRRSTPQVPCWYGGEPPGRNSRSRSLPPAACSATVSGTLRAYV